MSNIFRRSTIDAAKSSIFKGGVREKQELARAAGSRGFSPRQMDKTLKDKGYDPGKRSSIISKISGEDRKKGPSQEQIKRNIAAARQSFEAGQATEEFRKSRYSFGGQYLRTRQGAERVLGRAGGGVKGTTTRLGLGRTSPTGFAGQEPDKPASPPSPSPSSRPGGGIRPGF